MTEHSVIQRTPPVCKCPACRRSFRPDPRIGTRQRYCSRKECQARRQRRNERAWREANPECVVAQQKKWRDKNPGYMPQWLAAHPQVVQRNRAFMRRHMRRKRATELFVKSKEMLSQVVDTRHDVYVSLQGRWLMARLKRARRWSERRVGVYACGRIRPMAARVACGRVYDISQVWQRMDL